MTISVACRSRATITIAALVTFLLGLCSEAETRQNSVEVGGETLTAFCKLREGERVSQSTGFGAIECERKNHVLACDGRQGVSLEPGDFLFEDACRGRSLRFNRGESLSVSLRGRSVVEVDWLTVLPSGEVSVTATRARAGEQSDTLTLIAAPSRLLRFRTPGTAPVTIETAPKLPESVVLPPIGTGGELVGIVMRSTVEPIGLRLVGARTFDVDRRGRLLAVSGLSPGSYTALPVYRGGLTGDPVRFVVSAERSSFHWFNPADVGEFRVTITPEHCVPNFELRVVQSVTVDRGKSESEIVRLANDEQCSWSIAGLKPGTYRGEIEDGGRQYGSTADLAVAAQRSVSATVGWAGVRVSGTIQLNSKGIDGARLEFIQQGSVLPGEWTTTDAAGQFEIALQSPGAYMVEIKHTNVTRQLMTVQLRRGDNTFNYGFYGGKLTIRVSGALSGKPLTIHVDARRVPSADTVDPGTRTTVTFVKEGLQFGTYHVSAEQEDGGTTEIKTVEVTPSEREAEVTLDLRPSTATLVVTDQSGRPLPRATVVPLHPSNPLAMAGARLTESAPGVFPLVGLRPGISLLVRVEGFGPGCRMAQAQGEVTQALDIGRTVNVQLPNDLTFGLLQSFLIQSPSSDCAIPLVQFRPRLDATTGTVRMDNFPSSERVILSNSRMRYVAIVPTAGPLVLERQ